MAYATVNPYTGELVTTFPEATDAQIEAALAAGQAAFLRWRETSHAERAEKLRNLAAILRRDCAKHAALITLEMGKITAESKAEIETSAGIAEYFAAHAEKFLQPAKLRGAGKDDGEAMLLHQPLGALLAIEPWNFPYYQVMRVFAPQAAAGNVLLLKHASNVPQCAAAFADAAREAGFPEGVFQTVYATREQLSAIIKDDRIKGVALTGSAKAGAIVAAEAGVALKKITLELGGSDALIVLEDADLDKAVPGAIIGRHRNAGQICVASKRVIVAAPLYDEFLARYKQGVAALKAGDPADSRTTLAPLCSQKAADRLQDQLSQAAAHGARIEELGAKVPAKGAFVQPVVLTDIKAGNPVLQWELFGPATMIFRAENEADAIRIANSTFYGLGGSVFTRDTRRGAEVAAEIATGMVFINRPAHHSPALPFGGVNHSGFGRELGPLGIMEFVNHKLIDIMA